MDKGGKGTNRNEWIEESVENLKNRQEMKENGTKKWKEDERKEGGRAF